MNNFFVLFTAFLTLLTVKTSAQTKSSIPQINKTFQVQVHIVDGESGGSTFNSSQFNQSLSQVNGAFENIGVNFVVCKYDTIRNDRYAEIDSSKIEELFMVFGQRKRINVFVVDELDFSHCGFGSFEGISSAINDSIGGIVLTTSCTSEVFVREMGRFFGLRYTSDVDLGSELVDGSNCEVSGDQVCDTPADPLQIGYISSNYINGECEFVSTIKDSNNQEYDPLINNYMSFYPCSCNSFTDGQLTKMVENYNSGKVAW